MTFRLTTTTTVILQPFSLLMQELTGSSIQQPLPSLPILCHLSLSFSCSLFNLHSLMSFSTTWLHVILGLPHPLLPSTLNDMIFFTQSSSFHSTCPNHLNLFCFMVSDTDLIFPSALHSALYPSATCHTSISPSSFLYIPISHSAMLSWPTFHF